jgi:TolB protein
MINRLLFLSQGKTAMINSDGSGLRYLELDEPDQATWQASEFFADGHRVLMLSMEARRDGPGRPFAEYYHQTPTHLWIYDLDREMLTRIATRDRMAVFYTPQLLLNDERLLVQVIRDGVGQVYNMNLDGTDAQAVTDPGEGLPYGLSLSPDGQRLAFHLASVSGYQIFTSDVDGGHRVLVAAHAEYLYFGPRWSPDGESLLYQGCRYQQDPGHDWSDLYLSRPDGSRQRQLTNAQALWFGASYGPSDRHGGGSNMPSWTQDGAILVSRRLNGSRVPWEFQADRPDTDHFNRDYKPDLARGGTEICRIAASDGSAERLTHQDPPGWDFRASESPDGNQIVFCRARTGESPGLWVADADGGNARLLTRGQQERGADHPRWMPLPASPAVVESVTK